MWEKSKRVIQRDKRTDTSDVGTVQYEDGIVKCEKESKRTTKNEKWTVTFDVRTAQYNDGPVKYEKKEGSHQMWEKNSHIWCWNCTMWGWNCQMWEKSKGPPNVTNELSYVMLELYNVTLEPSNVRKKIRKPSNVIK